MEKRWCERVPVTAKIAIYYKGVQLGNCKAKNISLTGICLSSGPLSFHTGVSVQIKFPDASYLKGNIDSVNANVVHNNSSEVGLVFNPVEPELVQAIIKNKMAATDRQLLVMV